MEENLVLKAVLSQLIADRDNIVSIIDALLNGKNESETITNTVLNFFKSLTATEQTIEAVQKVIKFNANGQTSTTEIPDILDALNEFVNKQKTENNDNADNS